MGAVAEIAGVDGAVVGDRVLAAEGGRDGEADALREAREMVRGGGRPAGAADDGDRSGGVAKQRHQRVERERVGSLGGDVDAGAVGGFDLVRQHVLGKREDDGAGAAGHGRGVGAGDVFGEPAGVLDAGGPFGERREHRGKIDLLESLAVAVLPRDVADEEQHGGAVLHRGVDADRRVGRAGAAGDEADAGAAGELAVGLRGVGGAALLSAGDEVDLRRVVKRVERGEVGFAGYAEDAVAALGEELINKDAAAGSFGHGVCCLSPEKRRRRDLVPRPGVDAPPAQAIAPDDFTGALP